MNKKHTITIAGKLGSGKSSTSKLLANILGYQHYSTGDFMRSIAKDKGVSLGELSVMGETDSSIDKELDNHNIEIGKKENVVLDSRLGFYFIPEAFKVFLELDPEIASERILEDKKINHDRHTEAKLFDTKEHVIESIKSRLLSERKRYKDLYNIDDHTDHKNFDLVIDTSKFSLEEVSQKIIEEYNNWLKL